MALDEQFFREKAVRDVAKNWHYIPACSAIKKQLVTEEQARAWAEKSAAFECDVLQAWMTVPLADEHRQTYASFFVPAFLEVWRKLHPQPSAGQPTLWEVA